jgi:hypothetical protein
MGSFAKTGTAGTVAGATGLAAGAAGGAAAGLTEGSFQSFNAPGYTNGVSNRFASNSLSSYGTIKTGSVTRSDDGKTYNYQDFAVNRAKMNEIKRQMPDAVKGSTGSDGVFDASSGTFAELARVENNSPSFYASAVEYAKENGREDIVSSIRETAGVNNMSYQKGSGTTADTLRVFHNPDERTTAEKQTYRRTQIAEEQMVKMRNREGNDERRNVSNTVKNPYENMKKNTGYDSSGSGFSGGSPYGNLKL